MTSYMVYMYFSSLEKRSTGSSNDALTVNTFTLFNNIQKPKVSRIPLNPSHFELNAFTSPLLA